MSISYKGAQITGNSGEYFYRDAPGLPLRGPFQHYSEIERDIDKRHDYAETRFLAAEKLHR